MIAFESVLAVSLFVLDAELPSPSKHYTVSAWLIGHEWNRFSRIVNVLPTHMLYLQGQLVSCMLSSFFDCMAVIATITPTLVLMIRYFL